MHRLYVMRYWRPSPCKATISFLIPMLRQRNPVVDPVDFWDLLWLCTGLEGHDNLQPLPAVE